MKKPKRIKRSRGKKFPPNTKAVDRGSRWGNPFHVTETRPAAEAVKMFEDALVNGELPVSVEDVRGNLKGFNLACYCQVGDPCHGDVLLEIANERR